MLLGVVIVVVVVVVVFVVGVEVLFFLFFFAVVLIIVDHRNLTLKFGQNRNGQNRGGFEIVVGFIVVVVSIVVFCWSYCHCCWA